MEHLGQQASALKIADLIEFVLAHCVPKGEQKMQIESSQDSDSISEEQVDIKMKTFLNNLFGKYANDVTCQDVIDAIPEVNVNISLCSSMLACILENYETIDKNEQSVCVTKFFAKILGEVKKRNGLNKYITPTLLWDKKEMVSDLGDYKMSQNVVAYIMTYLNVNIFIVSHDEILLYCMGKLFNKYKQNILIYYDGLCYKPLVFKQSKIWLYGDDEPLKYFIKNNQQKIRIYQQNKNDVQFEFKIGNDNDVEHIWVNETEQKEKDAAALGESKSQHDDKIEEKITESEKKGTEKKSDSKISEKKDIPKKNEHEEKEKEKEKGITKKSKKDIKSDSDVKLKDEIICVKPVKKDKKEKVTEKEKEKTTDHPETTEQVLDAVFYKSDKLKKKDEVTTASDMDISAKQKLSEKKSKKSDEYSKDTLTAMKCAELRQLAIKKGIKLMANVNGKGKQKTKQELIDELLTI